MTEPVVLATEAEIRAALTNDRLAPPSWPGGGGSTVALRSAMARFSGPEEHPTRRRAVEATIAALDLVTVAAAARAGTARRLGQAGSNLLPVEAIAQVARPVAAEAIAAGFGVPDAALDRLVRDVDTVVAVIGRGGPSTVATADATDRLLATFASHPCGAVAAISTLYQSMDATAALVATTLLAGASVGPAVPIARTTRVAIAPTEIGGMSLPTGTPVSLELGVSGLWFGAGPHACPGRALAGSIVGSVVAAIADADRVVDVDRTEFDSDRRPTAVWLVG
jgi:cytochrome P450